VNAIAINSSMANGARLVGPAIAGVVIGALGEGWCFLLDGVSYFAVIASLVMMRIAPISVRRVVKSLPEELLEGWEYVRDFRPIRSILILFAIVSLLQTVYAVLLPIFAGEVLHGSAYTLGWLTAASGVGALASGITLAARQSVRGLTRTVQAATYMFGGALIVFGASKVMWLSVPMMAIVGFGMIQVFAGSNTIIQTLVSDDMRARVMSYYTLAFFGTAPFGSLLAGTLAHRIGAPYTAIVGGVIGLVAAIWFTFELPKVRAVMRPIYRQMGILPDPAAG